MEEHKALKYCDYRDKFYMIIGTENFDDTHPYIFVMQELSYRNNLVIILRWCIATNIFS